MRQVLVPHPDHPTCAVESIEVTIARPRPGALTLQFSVIGSIDEVLIPPPSDAGRADGLWQHSCLEIFFRLADDADYYELNFSPSLSWAAYRFGGYRSDRTDIDLNPPAITIEAGDRRYDLDVEVDGLPDRAWQVGLSAIIEEKDGRKSYWALAHPPGKADFHHPDSFALQLPAVTP